ncbi:MAG TPA: serine hydrolase domain-containing protein [Caulobacteraceae bacterium]|jgi:CubicO group peptidase (beta-lactamase class C family)|nr:serine hydrolase domain-containing protein [Caulobacteraceae bacterium]
MQTRIEERIDAVLEAELEPGGPGAAVAVIRDGEAIHRKAYGLANIEWGAPLDPDCVFRICSLTKQFTAVAIMMLAERGELSIDAPIETYLTDWPARGRTTTLRRLLNHTSGVWRHDSMQVERTKRPNPPVEEVIQLIYSQPFEFEPGARYRYNNSGYLLLGAIIAAVSGRPYEDFLREEIFEPLGMSRTGILRHEPITPKRAYGYVRGRKRFHNARLDAMSWSHAAGALGSTLDDLSRWDRAIRANRLISPESLETMLAPAPLDDGSSFPYGFGWGTAAYDGRRIYHHTGGISGFGCHMLHFRDEDLTTIVLSNLYLFPFDKITRGLLRAVLDLDDIGHHPVALTADQLAACTGRFDGDGYARELFARADGLAFVGDGAAALLPASATNFRQVNDPELQFRFSDLQGGRYQRLTCLSPLWPEEVLVRGA